MGAMSAFPWSSARLRAAWQTSCLWARTSSLLLSATRLERLSLYMSYFLQNVHIRKQAFKAGRAPQFIGSISEVAFVSKKQIFIHVLGRIGVAQSTASTVAGAL